MGNENRDERSFGLSVGTILALLGGWWTYREKLGELGPALLAAGLILVACAATRPGALVRPRKAWMALAEALSSVMTWFILFVVFALVLTPIGLVRKLLGADPLRRRAPLGESAWHPYPRRHLEPRHYEKSY